MRVLMLGWEFPPFVTGGLGAACRGITEGLAEVGVDVLFVVPRSSGEAERHGASVVGCNERAGEPVAEAAQPAGPRRVDVLGVSSSLRPYLRPGQRSARAASPAPAFTGGYGQDLFGEVERYADVVATLAAERDFDLIHAHDWMTFAAGRSLRERTRRPLVCHVHALERDRAGEDPDPRILAAEASGLHHADRVVCVSRYTADRLRADYDVPEDRLRVVHNAIRCDAAAVRPGRPHRRRASGTARTARGGSGCTVLFLGRVTAQKGPGTFLDAAAMVLRENPDVRFIVAGTGDQLPAMVEQAAELGLAREVRFTGFVDEEELEVIWSRVDLFVLSSVSEPFGLTPLEALAHGVPAIVTLQSGVSEVLTSAPKYDCRDTRALADKILTLSRNPSLRRQLASAGRLELEDMRWERRAASLLGIYRELVHA